MELDKTLRVPTVCVCVCVCVCVRMPKYLYTCVVFTVIT